MEQAEPKKKKRAKAAKEVKEIGSSKELYTRGTVPSVYFCVQHFLRKFLLIQSLFVILQPYSARDKNSKSKLKQWN